MRRGFLASGSEGTNRIAHHFPFGEEVWDDLVPQRGSHAELSPSRRQRRGNRSQSVIVGSDGEVGPQQQVGMVGRSSDKASGHGPQQAYPVDQHDSRGGRHIRGRRTDSVVDTTPAGGARQLGYEVRFSEVGTAEHDPNPHPTLLYPHINPHLTLNPT